MSGDLISAAYRVEDALVRFAHEMSHPMRKVSVALGLELDHALTELQVHAPPVRKGQVQTIIALVEGLRELAALHVRNLVLQTQVKHILEALQELRSSGPRPRAMR